MSEKGTLATLLRIFPYAKSALPRIALGMVAAIAAHLFALAIPQFLRDLVNSLKDNGTAETLIPAVLFVLLLGLLEGVAVLLRRWLVLTPGTHVEAGLRAKIYSKLQDLPVSFHDKWPSGQLLSRATGDLSLIRRWLSFGLVLFVANGLTIIVGLAILFTFHWMLGLIFFICSIPIWVKGFQFERNYHSVARLSQDQAGDLATSVEESVHGIRVLKAFGRGDHIAGKFAAEADTLRGTEIKKAGLIAGIWIYLILAPEFAVGLSLLAGVWLVSIDQLTVGGLVAFLATTTALRWPTESIGFLLSMTLDAKTAIQRFFEVIDTPVDIADPENPKTITEPHGRLEFKGVHFRYSDAHADQPDLLNGVDLVLEPGESVALIGITGCGKTSLTALTTRLYDVTGGQVLLDGVDVRDLTREELRTHISMAFEDATLFSASVRDNVWCAVDGLGERVPVRLILAEHDQVLNGQYHGSYVAAHVPGAQASTVPGAGHFAFMTQPSMSLPSAAGDAAANPAGFDRVAFQPQLDAQVLQFFARRQKGGAQRAIRLSSGSTAWVGYRSSTSRCW